MRITFLGTGTSVGVPRIGCECPVCLSDDPRNNRLRSSILIEYRGRNVLVDTGPDLRTQALRYRIGKLDAVLFTHGHADHLHGLDDVRAFCFEMENPLPCYGDSFTVERIGRVFDYAFNSPYRYALPQLSLHLIEGPFNLFGEWVEPISVYHGKLPVFGFRLGRFAYLTDCNSIPDASMDKLRDLDVLVLDALRYKEHPTHFNVEQALVVIETLRPGKTFLTHIAHELDHRGTNRRLPPQVELAYDGLVLEVN